MTAVSSGTISRRSSLNWCRSSAFATAGPDASGFSPREQESLTVRTAARTSGVEEDIFALSCGVALRFVQQPQPFHEQTLGVQGRGLLGRLSFEIDLEISFRPAQHLEHGLITGDRSIGRMTHLPAVKE